MSREALKHNGSVSIARWSGSGESDVIVITIKSDGAKIAQITLDLAAFSSAITGRTETPGEIRTWPIGGVL